MKKNIYLFQVKGLTLLFMLISFLVGCSETLAPLTVNPANNPALASVSKRAADLQSVQSIGVAPISFSGAGSGAGSGVHGALNRESVGQDDVRALNEELLRSFDAELSLKVLHLYQGGAVAARGARGALGGGVGGKAFDFASSADIGADAVAMGTSAGVDAVLVTTVRDYQERVGSAIGADAPARVSFTMSLVRVGDRSEIWSAIYTFQDRSLLDNLTTLGPAQEGALGWRKAREIVAQAFTNSARDLEDKRLVQFLRR